MNAETFVLQVKAKLNRLDSAAYEDVRVEEIYFFGYDALKDLTIDFDSDQYGKYKDDKNIHVYLASLIKHSSEQNLVDNKIELPDVFKIKSMAVFVTIGAGDQQETGWQPGREIDAHDNTETEYNPFTRSYPDKPAYRLIDDNIEFFVNDFICSKLKYDYLVYPAVIDDASDLDMVFIKELQDKTVTLILENLESRRIQSQPVVSRS